MLATMVSVEGGYLSLLPGLMVFGVGVGLLMSPSTAAITESLPAEKQGVASALNDTVRELGGAIGIALLGSLDQLGLPLERVVGHRGSVARTGPPGRRRHRLGVRRRTEARRRRAGRARRRS